MRGGDEYSSNGHFAIDFILLGAELAGILYYWSRTKARAEPVLANSTYRP